MSDRPSRGSRDPLHELPDCFGSFPVHIVAASVEVTGPAPYPVLLRRAQYAALPALLRLRYRTPIPVGEPAWFADAATEPIQRSTPAWSRFRAPAIRILIPGAWQ